MNARDGSRIALVHWKERTLGFMLTLVINRGLATDGRVLRDAISRINGLKVLQGGIATTPFTQTKTPLRGMKGVAEVKCLVLNLHDVRVNALPPIKSMEC
ncbi:hypothetical protein Pint_35669 [Pistacia integerrima]|uniref:Uncharacterized protein n=1 Tax=Pistacia integerrima TaxID=434235 RepID=A0ACC0Y3K2_9ROSI|nr:hypothetical protein Pint_35669 [Pistacia integerrima]